MTSKQQPQDQGPAGWPSLFIIPRLPAKSGDFARIVRFVIHPYNIARYIELRR